jgi:protein-S-isoprenylcysteine O-methyltransferase Ste14
MKNLTVKAIGGLVFLDIFMGMAFFIPAGTFRYWQAWVYLAVFSSCTLAVTLYLMKNDPELLARRVNAGPGAEKEKNQKIIQVFSSIAFYAILIFPALDYRFRWSPVSLFVSLFGDMLVALGLYFVFLVFKENSFTSATIEINKKQKVISTGPYGYIRHPMYAGAFVMLFGTPLALGSFFGLFVVLPLIFVIIVRLLAEEKFLVKNLPGYEQYRKKVPFRIIPNIW